MNPQMRREKAMRPRAQIGNTQEDPSRRNGFQSGGEGKPLTTVPTKQSSAATNLSKTPAVPADRGQTEPSSNDTDFGYSKLTTEWYLYRVPAQYAVMTIGVVLGIWWQWWPGFVVAGLAFLAYLETRLRLRQHDRSPFLSILLDTTLIGAGVYFSQVPLLAMPLPFLTTVATALMLLPLKRALWIGGYALMILGIAITASIHTMWSPMTGARGTTVGLIAIAIFSALLLRLIWVLQGAISEGHQREQEILQESVSANAQLVASVSHEIRTPLTAVLGFIELLADERSQLSEPERAELLMLTSTQGRDLSQLLEDLLVAARSGAGILHVAEVPVNLDEQVNWIVKSWTDPAAARITVEGGPARALGEPARVRQILRNLVSNAFRYGGDNIGIELSEDEATVQVTVWDDGDEIDLDQRERIFERYQSGANHATLPDSIGLGLPVSRDLARLMGGDLAYSFRSGRNRFTLTLRPLLTDSTAGAEEDMEPDPAPVSYPR
jgi:signal transduction histidine kinase